MHGYRNTCKGQCARCMHATPDTVQEVEEIVASFCDSVSTAGREENTIVLVAETSAARSVEQPCYAEIFNMRTHRTAGGEYAAD